MSTITTKDGTEIYYKDWGEGPVVTFSHGWPLSADAWDGQMLFLAQNGFRVVAHDRRGHGRSSQASSGNDMDGYADDLAAVIEALDLRDATLVGHSTGGGEVARYIGRHGTGRVAKAVLVSAVPPLMLKIRGQSRGPADRGVRRPARGPGQGSVAVLQGPGHAVLRRQQAGRQGLAGRAGSVLAVEHAVRPQERLREHQGLLRDRLHRGPQEVRRARPWSCTARTTRSFPSRTRRGNRPSSSRARRRSTIRARRTASRPPIRISSTPTCWPSCGASHPPHPGAGLSDGKNRKERPAPGRQQLRRGFRRATTPPQTKHRRPRTRATRRSRCHRCLFSRACGPLPPRCRPASPLNGSRQNGPLEQRPHLPGVEGLLEALGEEGQAGQANGAGVADPLRQVLAVSWVGMVANARTWPSAARSPPPFAATG